MFYTNIFSGYRRNVIEVKKDYTDEKEAKVLKLFIKHLKKVDRQEEAQQYEKELSLISRRTDNEADNDSDKSDSDDGSHDSPNIGEDIYPEDVTDVSEEENEECEKSRVQRKRGKGFAIKKNAKGETQLHQACISGNATLVTRLLSQGHPVNVRDNAGWLPLHEACIHGKKNIVEILLENGAHINDRGGTQCDGITPIHDAASNGFLEIVETLLNHGASPSIKTDNGETVLDTLRRWRKQEVLDATEQIFYESLCSRIQKSLEKIGEVHENVLHERNVQNCVDDEKIPDLRKRSSARSSREFTKRISSEDKYDHDLLLSQRSKNRNYVDEDSSSSSPDVNVSKKENRREYLDGVKDYKNAMQSLRNRHNNIFESDSDSERHDQKDKGKKSALLDPDEVGEDWLEDDIGICHSKKRKRQNSFDVDYVKRKPKTTASPFKIASDNNILHQRTPSKNSPMKLVSENVENNSCDALFDSDSDVVVSDSNNKIITDNDAIDSSKTKNDIKRKIWKRQLTLTKTGFTRNKTSRPRYIGNVETMDASSTAQMPLSEPDSTTEQSYQQYVEETANPQVIQLLHDNTSNLNRFNSIHMNAYMPCHTVVPPTGIKVRIQDKLFMIPVHLDKVETSTISWLAKEVARRYYNMEGMQPTLCLSTSDGALLADEDPLSFVIGSTELHANVTSWNLPPIGDRYIECCGHLKIEVDDHIRNIIEASRATHKLNISNLCLTSTQVQPIFKSLYHQLNITDLLLSNNCLGNDGLRHLVLCLPTLSQIKLIDLSGNSIDCGGMKLMLDAFETCRTGTPDNPIDFNVSFNPIGDAGFKYLMKLTSRLRFRSLRLKSCDVTAQAAEVDTHGAILKDLEVLDLSFNTLRKSVVHSMMCLVNPYLLTTLKFQNLNINGHFASSLLDTCGLYKLKELDLSRCNLIDADISEILRSVSKCEHLQTLKLRYNPELTALSLKKLIRHYPSFVEIDLRGCPKIFKYLNETDLCQNWFMQNEYCNIKSIILTVDEEMTTEIDRVIQQFSDMWTRKWENGDVNRESYGEIVFKT